MYAETIESLNRIEAMQKEMIASNERMIAHNAAFLEESKAKMEALKKGDDELNATLASLGL